VRPTASPGHLVVFPLLRESCPLFGGPPGGKAEPSSVVIAGGHGQLLHCRSGHPFAEVAQCSKPHGAPPENSRQGLRAVRFQSRSCCSLCRVASGQLSSLPCWQPRAACTPLRGARRERLGHATDVSDAEPRLLEGGGLEEAPVADRGGHCYLLALTLDKEQGRSGGPGCRGGKLCHISCRSLPPLILL